MATERTRLLSIIEYAQQSARMKAAPVANVTTHDLFSLWEQEAQSRPGVIINPDGAAEDDERWLLIQRLQQSNPPAIKNALLKPWVEVAQSPSTGPKLRQLVSGQDLISAGTHRKLNEMGRLIPEQNSLPEIDPKITVSLSEYERASQVEAEFSNYQSQQWIPWAEREKAVRQTIALYSKLFTLRQQLEDGIVEKTLELAWGVGIGVWENSGAKVSYPLITRLVELSLDEKTGSLEIRPRDVQPRLELDWYASADNQGVAAVEKAGKEFFQRAAQTLSPFDRGSFEPLLRSAVTHLDPNGLYRPDHVSPEDRSVPKMQSINLIVTDTWVLFARPRSANLFVQDLERFKEYLASSPDVVLPQAVCAVVTEPATTNEEVQLPEFRGVSMSCGEDLSNGAGSLGRGSKKVKDLFFPKPFNDEQVRIVQLLEVSDGVVVQGPPGTGKTHTIANVISHYLANGNRVLVTSMKDPALGVLRDQLPEDIRPLAISLLSTELDGMKQFEHAINKIASEVQSIDRTITARQIVHLETNIDGLHGQIARLDYEIARWAKANLERIDLDGERIDPQDAAREVVQGQGQYEWLEDKLDPSANCAPIFTNEDIIKLREARRVLGQDMVYLGADLPLHSEFPESRLLLQVHQDLGQLEVLKVKLDVGQVPSLIDSTEETLAEVRLLLSDIDSLDAKRVEIASANRSWPETIRNQIVKGQNTEAFQMLSALGRDLVKEKEVQKEFYRRPVNLPPGFESDHDLYTAVESLALGQRPFGVMGLFGKGHQKGLLRQVRVLDQSQLQEPEDWRHVLQFLEHRRRLRQLAVRWNALCQESGLDELPGTQPEHGLAALHQYQLFERIIALVSAEKMVSARAEKLFPSFEPSRRVLSDVNATRSLADALQHHITKNRLSAVWVAKDQFQKVLQGKTGPIVTEISQFLSRTLGNPLVGDAQLQSQWTALMIELARVQGLSDSLAVITDITGRIAQSGAPIWAAQCRLPLTGATDSWLPDNWRTAWRLRRLATYLDAIDAQLVLKKLAKDRLQVVHDLARAYEAIVSKRTWLKLAENAAPSVRAALAAYLNAIQNIPITRGAKRAVRYRKDARDAAAAANPAVPCWIMPHHRISESLPPELGCFDLVIIDEASQSDLAALPALLRAKKVLVVGDDKQVSPEGVGLEEEKIKSLMSRFLQDQIPSYRPQLSPDRSLYDLFKVVFARSSVMLKEHFRSVPSIIEYSKREFYNHELRPLRIPCSSERIDPPLVDVLVEDGFRSSGDINRPEADFILHEIKRLTSDERMLRRSIGVVSLLADKQALYIWELLTDALGPELIRRHRIACGDARTFQGKERDIMFLSMVSAANDRGAALSRDTFAQRFNVAASRARDRMYLVRSLELDQLSDKDILRRGLITHFSTPFRNDEEAVKELRSRCESPFECEIYDQLTRRGFRVVPQVKVGNYRIDMVVEGANDERLAIECDGDRYHGVDKWADDMQRQRILERAGWVFWRCFASAYVRRSAMVLEDLLNTLRERGIEPMSGENIPQSVHCEFRRVRASELVMPNVTDTVDEKSTPETAQKDCVEPTLSEADRGNLKAGREEKSHNRQAPKLVSAALPFDEQSSMHVGSVDGEGRLRAFLDNNGLSTEDNRKKNGALWINLDDESSAPAQQLAKWGFKYKKGRGWWKK